MTPCLTLGNSINHFDISVPLLYLEINANVLGTSFSSLYIFQVPWHIALKPCTLVPIMTSTITKGKITLSDFLNKLIPLLYLHISIFTFAVLRDWFSEGKIDVHFAWTVRPLARNDVIVYFYLTQRLADATSVVQSDATSKFLPWRFTPDLLDIHGV